MVVVLRRRVRGADRMRDEAHLAVQPTEAESGMASDAVIAAPGAARLLLKTGFFARK